MSRIVAAMCVALAASAGVAQQTQVRKISPFGIGADSRTGGNWGPWVPQMAEAGIRTMRTPGLWWGGIEPEQGTFNFTRVDEQLAMAEKLGITTGGMFIGLAKWDTKDERGGLPLKSLEEWGKYVEAVVKHVDGKIKYWEVWNEVPNFTAPKGGKPASPEDYAKVMVATYNAVKRADPTALVGLAVKSVDINYMDRAIRGGAKDHFDYLSFHPYETLGFVIDDADAEPVFMNIVPAARKMLAELQPDKVNCPVWVTELGCNADRKGADVQGQALVKAYAMGIAQGMETICWFEGMDGDSGPMGLLQRDGTPRPSYTAMKSMTTHLGTYPEALGWTKINDKDYAFAFKGAKGDVLIAWAPKGATDRVDFGQSVTVVDPLTGQGRETSSVELTNAPIIVPNAPAKWIAQARANKGKSLTWGEDYSKANSVSITMEEKTIEKGLHTRAGEALAADVLDYGGNARAGNAPKGNVYMVDPTFLTYTKTPIEITAQVRRNPKNDPAKIGLEYESTSGYSKVKPFEIPDNKQWYTATWRIDDPMFVGKYGFNFRLDPGKYYIKSVTVTKLDPRK